MTPNIDSKTPLQTPLQDSTPYITLCPRKHITFLTSLKNCFYTNSNRCTNV